MDIRFETFGTWCQKQQVPYGLISGEEAFLMEKSIQLFKKALLAKQPTLKTIRIHIEKSSDWALLLEQIQQRDFFSTKQLFVCSYMPSTLPKKNDLIERILQSRHAEQWILFACKKRIPKNNKAFLHQQCKKNGFHLALWPLNPKALTQWIKQACHEQKQTLSGAQINLLIDKTDAQPWAMDQAMERLRLLCEQGPIDDHALDDAITMAHDPAIYTLINEAMMGKAKQALIRLSSQDTHSILPMLTASLYKEVRLLYQIAWSAKQGQSMQQAIQAHCRWPSKQIYVQQALKRHTLSTLSHLLRCLFSLDKIYKGMQLGDANIALQDIIILLATAKSNRLLALS